MTWVFQKVSKLEADVVRPFNPTFYDRYVDDCFSKKRKDEPDQLLDRLNNYHPNIKFTVEENPEHFLDTSKNGKRFASNSPTARRMKSQAKSLFQN